MATQLTNVSFKEHIQNCTCFERVCFWIHEHPTTTKVMKVAGLTLGIGLLASVSFTAPVLGVGLVVGIAVTGVFLTLVSTVALLALDFLISPHHDMKNHAYTPAECEGGKLYYEGDVPILTLDADDPFKAGKAHGYLCGDAISALTRRFHFALHTIEREPTADQLPQTLEALRSKIPAEYLLEMQGLVEGYNQWANEQPWWEFPKKLTVDDLLLIHLIPDSNHFVPGTFEHGIVMPERSLAIACSAFIDKDSPQGGLVMARNMDWPSLGIAGAKTLVINRKHRNGLASTVEVAVPGFVGAITGMNEQGLSVAMNVCPGTTNEVRGMPACFYNRYCLERCRTVQEVEALTQNQSPLGPYHMTVADRNRAQSIHFYQSLGGTDHVIRRWEENRPLATLNCRYDPQPNCHMHYGEEREQEVNAFFQNRQNRPLEEALALPHVNNWETTHRVVMEPQTRSFRVAFDNAFAGKEPLHRVPTEKLFQ